MVRILGSAVFATMLSVSAFAGNVLVVDAGGSGSFTQIQPAVLAAVDGDAILVKSGNYTGFSISDKTLSVVADNGANVVVQGQVRVDGLASSRSVLLSGLRIVPSASSAFAAQNDLGGVRVHGCWIAGANGSANGADGLRGAELANVADIAFTACVLSGGHGSPCQDCGQCVSGAGGDGFHSDGSSVALHNCTLDAGDGGDGVPMGCGFTDGSSGGPGGSACAVQGGFLFAEASAFQGGDGGRGGDGLGNLCLGGSANGCGGAGADGLRLSGSSPLAVLLGNNLAGGAGGTHGAVNPCFGDQCGGSAAPNGAAINAPAGAVTQLAGTARALTAPSVARENTIIPIAFHGEPGDHVWIYLARRPSFSLNLPFHGVNLTPVPPLARLISFGTIPASGTLDTHFVLPDYGMDSKTLFMQSLFRNSANERFLASPLTLVELDSAF